MRFPLLNPNEDAIQCTMGVSIVLTISKITNSSGQDFAQIWLQNNHFHSRPIHSPKNFKYFHSIVPQNHITFNSSQKTSFHQPVKSLIRLLIESLSNIQNLKDMTKYFFLPPSKIQNFPPPLENTNTNSNTNSSYLIN